MSKTLLAVSLGALVVAAPALAHHGFGRFDPTKDVTIEGTVTGIDFVNPHAYLYFDAMACGRQGHEDALRDARRYGAAPLGLVGRDVHARQARRRSRATRIATIRRRATSRR